MQVCKVGIDGCALAPLASARVEDGIANVRSATAHKPTKDCRHPHTRVMVRAGFSFQVNAQIPSDVMRANVPVVVRVGNVPEKSGVTAVVK